VKEITIALQPTGSIVGIVYQPDGRNPVDGGRVNGAPIGSDGTFRIDGVPFGPLELRAYDSQGRWRAVGSASVAAPGDTQVSLTFVALGTVTGRVLNPDASSASDMRVEIHSPTPLFGGYFAATTNAAGFYEIDDVPAGTVTLVTGDRARGLIGEGSGAIVRDGESLTIDVILVRNAVNLPVYRSHANGLPFDPPPHP